MFGKGGLGERPSLLLAGTLLLSAGIFMGVVIGGWGGAKLSALHTDETTLLREQVTLLETQLAALQQVHANIETRGQVDAAALELVRAELADQRQTIADLEQGLRFYRGLMAPEDIEQGLSIRGFEVQQGQTADHFMFRMVVQQQASKHEQVSGELSVRIVGELAGETAVLELSTLSEQVPRPAIRLKFKYFQAIDGEMVLPGDFVPQQVVVEGAATRPRKVEISQTFDWPARLKS